MADPRLLIFAPVVALALFGNVAHAESEYLFSEVGENQVLSAVLPDGFVVSDVVFASYGLPVEYTKSDACHSEASDAVVASYALGQQQFSINASNDLFGDPCPGIYKRLQVILAISPAGTTSSSSSTTEVATTTTSSTTTTAPEETTTEPATTTTTTGMPVETAPTTTEAEAPIPTAPVVVVPPPNLTTSSVASTTTPTTIAEPTTNTPSSEVTTTWLQPLPSTTATTTQSPTSTLASTTTQMPDTAPETTVRLTVPSVTTTLATAPQEMAQGNPTLTTEGVLELVDEIGQATPEQVAQLIEAVQSAPDDVRREFEAQVDLYSGTFDEYVPVGSSVPVKTRRILIAVSVATTLPVARRRAV